MNVLVESWGLARWTGFDFILMSQTGNYYKEAFLAYYAIKKSYKVVREYISILKISAFTEGVNTKRRI